MNGGFIRLGIMGKPMACHLNAGGRTVDSHGRSGVASGLGAGNAAATTMRGETGEVKFHQEDLDLAPAGARALGLYLPNTATAREPFDACVAHGGRAGDPSAMARALEAMANHEDASAPAP